MRPEDRSRVLLAITRSKAKMYEYGLPEPDHIRIPRDPARLLRLAVGMLGDLASAVSRNGTDPTGLGERASSLRFAARFFDACSNAYASLKSFGSLHARPMKLTPTGIPKTNPAGTVMCG